MTSLREEMLLVPSPSEFMVIGVRSSCVKRRRKCYSRRGRFLPALESDAIGSDLKTSSSEYAFKERYFVDAYQFSKLF